VGKRKKLPVIENLEITDVAAEGKSIGKYNNQVIFVKGLIPGDIADIQITSMRKKFMEGYAKRMIKYSEMRTDPFCSHFGICGGCKWQNLPYENQLFYKQKQVADNLQRIGKIDLPEISPIIGSVRQKYYRNKLEYTFSESRWLTGDEVKSEIEIPERRALGFHLNGKFDRILDIETCYLQDDLGNQIRNAVRNFTINNNYSFYNQRQNTGLMRNLIIRNTLSGEWMVIVVFNDFAEAEINGLMNFLKENFPQITSLFYAINPKVNDTIHDQEIVLFHGKPFMLEEIGGLKFKLGPKSFFQTNIIQAAELYRIALKYSKIRENEIVYDLYTGIGTIALLASKKCKKDIGIDYIEEAIEDARENSKLNEIRNAEFFAGDMKDLLTEDFITHHGQPDVIITDPPRGGMHPDVVKTILYASPERIIYVSCNPATQARDIQLLSEKYKVTGIQPVDMFPHTHHVENVACMVRF
jgi:23S rRNA (uracil1939-C5)-methyltransferase